MAVLSLNLLPRSPLNRQRLSPTVETPLPAVINSLLTSVRWVLVQCLSRASAAALSLPNLRLQLHLYRSSVGAFFWPDGALEEFRFPNEYCCEAAPDEYCVELLNGASCIHFPMTLGLKGGILPAFSSAASSLWAAASSASVGPYADFVRPGFCGRGAVAV